MTEGKIHDAQREAQGKMKQDSFRTLKTQFEWKWEQISCLFSDCKSQTDGRSPLVVSGIRVGGPFAALPSSALTPLPLVLQVPVQLEP